MSSISGTVILCDQIYQAQGGKFVLAGTYTTIEVRCASLRDVEHQVNGLNLYLRMRPEQLGVHQCQVLIRDEMRPLWQEPVMRNQWEVRVDERTMRLVEMAMVSPPFVIRAQAPAGQTVESLAFKYSIEFRVGGEIVATTPLDVTFRLGTRG